MKRFLGGAACAALALSLRLPAGAAAPCSRETLQVHGTPVTISYCVTGPGTGQIGEEDLPVQATYSDGGTSFVKTSVMKFATNVGPARLLESVDLAPLGITGTLRLTLVYAQGTVRIQNALLTPGAITIK
jgi:hypothetical protein